MVVFIVHIFSYAGHGKNLTLLRTPPQTVATTATPSECKSRNGPVDWR